MNKTLLLISLFIMSIISIFYWALISKNELHEAKWNAPDTTLAITINGEISTTFPTTSAYTGTVECSSGTGKVEWNGSKWVLTTSGITKGSTKCNATFATAAPEGWYSAGSGTLLASLRDNNTLKTPLTTPGKEVSAHTLNDTESVTASVTSSDSQEYYATYGTGWEVNGTKFNLTGAAVTSDIYANSYSSLVGKYLPSNSIYTFGSMTAGTMKTTTNLSSVYYVVSATSRSYTYKVISSNKNTTEALLASTEDDYGTSYYFRGAVKNNYVHFANKCWRIVRVNGDGTIKLILHNDNTSGARNPCSSANNSGTAAFAKYSGTTYKSEFNSSTVDNAYIGFMYGTTGASDYASTHTNTSKSTILTNLETWYTNNLASYESKLTDTVWCNDKTNVTDTTFNPWNWSNVNGLGYAKNVTYYGATQRLLSSDNDAGGTGPSVKCNGELSKITTKIGLLTADEIAFSGSIAYTDNCSTYLWENASGTFWWSLSPDYFNGSVAHVWYVDYGSFQNTIVSGDFGLRPAVSLISSTTISGGSGTSEDPYVVN